MIANRTRALEEGAKAHEDGKDIDKSNPYQPGIDDHENFREGFKAHEQGVAEEDVHEIPPAPPAPVAVSSTPLVHDDIVSEHPATNVESGTPFDVGSGTTEVHSLPVTHVASANETTFTNS